MSYLSPSPTGILVGSGGAAVNNTGAGTGAVTQASCTIPANLMGKNGVCIIEAIWTNNNNANNKNALVTFGGSQVVSLINTTNTTTSIRKTILNRNATNSQVMYNASNQTPYGVGTATPTTTAVDTTAAVTVNIQSALANQTDNQQLEYWAVWVYPHN